MQSLSAREISAAYPKASKHSCIKDNQNCPNDPQNPRPNFKTKFLKAELILVGNLFGNLHGGCYITSPCLYEDIEIASCKGDL